MANVGKLSVELQASVAKFQEDLGRATRVAEASSQRMTRAFQGIKVAAGAIGVALSVGAVGAWSREMIRAGEELQDLSESTGSTVEALSRLKNIAAIDGAEFETFKGAIERLAAGMAGAEEGSTKTAQALKFLGVTANDPAQALEEIAKKLDTFADGAGKAALAKDLFGRSGVSFLSTLKQIATAGDVAASMTTKQAAEASRLAETYRTLQVNAERFKNELLGGVLPTLSRLLEEFVEGRRIAGGFFEALRLFGTLDPFRNLGDQIRDVSKALDEATQLSQQGGFYGFLSSLSGDYFGRAAADAKKQIEFLKFQQRQAALALISPENDDARDIRARMKPALPYQSTPERPRGGGVKDDPTKKLLEGALRSIEAYTEEERDILRTRVEYLDRYFDAGFLSVADYFAKKREAQEEDLRVTVEGFDRQIAELDRYKAERGRTQTEIADTDNKIVELTKKRQLAEQQAAKTAVTGWFDQQRVVTDYLQKVEELRAKLLELEGNSAAATSLRLKNQNDAFRSAAAAQGDFGTVAEIDRYTKMQVAQASLNDEARRFNEIMEGVAVQVDRVAILQQAGAVGEIEALTRISELNKAKVDELGAIANGYMAIAQAANNPAWVNAAERMKNQVLALEKQGDLVAQKFNTIFADSFANFFSDVVSGTKSVKDAFQDLERSIVQSITNIAARSLADALFKGSGPGSGIGDFFSKIFAGLFGSGGGGDILTGLQGFAAGGNPPVGRLSLVGERGPELIFPRAPMTVAPLAVAAGGGAGRRAVTITQHINVLPGASTQSARQAAAAVRDSTVRAIKDR